MISGDSSKYYDQNDDKLIFLNFIPNIEKKNQRKMIEQAKKKTYYLFHPWIYLITKGIKTFELSITRLIGLNY